MSSSNPPRPLPLLHRCKWWRRRRRRRHRRRHRRRGRALRRGGAATTAAAAAPEVSHLGWGHWYTLRELEAATKTFSNENVIGEGGYGIVYHDILEDKTQIVVKILLNKREQTGHLHLFQVTTEADDIMEVQTPVLF